MGGRFSSLHTGLYYIAGGLTDDSLQYELTRYRDLLADSTRDVSSMYEILVKNTYDLIYLFIFYIDYLLKIVFCREKCLLCYHGFGSTLLCCFCWIFTENDVKLP